MGAVAHAERIVQLHEVGLSFSELGEIYGTSRNAIAGIIWRSRNPYKRKGRRRGESSPHAKMTEAQVREIRSRRLAGERLAVLATEFGVGPSSIFRIAAGKTWTHVQ